MSNPKTEFREYYQWMAAQSNRAAEDKKKAKLVNELRELSKDIIHHCMKNQYDVAVESVNKLNQKLETMDDEMILQIGTGALRDVLLALESIHSANKMAVLRGLSAITFKNPLFREWTKHELP